MVANGFSERITLIADNPSASFHNNRIGRNKITKDMFDSSVVLCPICDILEVLDYVRESADVCLCIGIKDRRQIFDFTDSLKLSRIDMTELADLFSSNSCSVYFSSRSNLLEFESLFGCKMGASKIIGNTVSLSGTFEDRILSSPNKELCVAWCGPIEEGNFPTIRRIVEDFYDGYCGEQISVHLIGNCTNASNIDIIDLPPRTRFIFCGPMGEDGNANRYLRENVHFVISCGETALRASGSSVPVFVFSENNEGLIKYSPIQCVVDYSYDWGRVISDVRWSAKEVLDAVSGADYARIAKGCFDYCISNTTSRQKEAEFYDFIARSEMDYSVLMCNPSIKSALCGLQSKNKDMKKFLGRKEDRICENRSLMKATGSDYAYGQRIPVCATVRVKISKGGEKLMNACRRLYGFSRVRGYKICKYVYLSLKCRKVQKSYPMKLKRIIEANRGSKIKVGFILVFKPSFPLRGLFDEMLRGDVFDPYLIIAPNPSRSHQYMMKMFNEAYDSYYPDYGERVIKGYNPSDDSYLELGNQYPLLIFCNPYNNLVHPYHSHEYFLDKDVLMIYANYGYAAIRFWKEVITTKFYNDMWKVCVENVDNYRYLKGHEPIRGHNGIVTGYAKMDNLSKVKVDKGDRKKILICPHHTVWGWNVLNISNFLKYSELFIRLPKMFPQVDFIFRPHPLLFPNLVEYAGWSQKQVDKYLARLLICENISYSTTADYSEEFMNSDAMIHDCASFTAEYLFTNNPCCYMIKGRKETFKTMLPFGKECLSNYYLATDEEQIVGFIQDVVIGGKDYLNEKRTEFVETKLRVNYPKVSVVLAEMLSRELGRL